MSDDTIEDVSKVVLGIFTVAFGFVGGALGLGMLIFLVSGGIGIMNWVLSGQFAFAILWTATLTRACVVVGALVAVIVLSSIMRGQR